MDKNFSFSEFKQTNEPVAEYVLHPAISKDYKVFINDTEVPVYTCRTSKFPYNRGWPGWQRPIDQTDVASYINIVSEGTITVRIEVLKSFNEVYIKPYSREISHIIDKNTVTFELAENGQYIFETDDYHNCLYIFNSKAMHCEAPENITHYFGPGIHFAGKITLNSNESLYVDKDAYVYGWIYAENAENIHIYGNGVIDGSGEERVGWRFLHANGNIKLRSCKNVKIDGVAFTNSALWCFSMFECENICADGIKIFGQWRYNTDGIDIVNSSDVLIKNSFIHSFDDNITIKGLIKHAAKNNENITIEKCVHWCDWGRALEIGIETKCDEYRNIRFYDCDIIRGGCIALEINNGNYAEVHDVVFENIRVEYDSFYTPEELQMSDDASYSRENEFADTMLINLTNPDLASILRVPKEKHELKMGNGNIHDIAFKNIYVYYDKQLPLVDGKYDLKINSNSTDDTITYKNVSVENIFVNGKKLSKEEMLLSGNNIEGVKFN